MDDLLSRLNNADQAAFERLADALTSSQDPNARKQAEELYGQLLQQKPDLAIRYLVAGLEKGEDLRRFCCLYLRKVRGHAVAYSIRSRSSAAMDSVASLWLCAAGQAGIVHDLLRRRWL